MTLTRIDAESDPENGDLLDTDATDQDVLALEVQMH